MSKQFNAGLFLATMGAFIAEEDAVCLECGSFFGKGLDGIITQVGHKCLPDENLTQEKTDEPTA